MFYRVLDDKLYDYADYKYKKDCNETSLCTTEEYNLHPDKYMIKDNVLVLNPNYEYQEEHYL